MTGQDDARQPRRPLAATGLFRRFLPFARPYRGYLVVVLIATLLRPVLMAAKVWLLKILIDDVIRGQHPGLLLDVCAGYLGIALLKGIAAFGDDFLGGWVGAHIVRDLRASVYDHLLGLSLRFYHTQRLGDLLARLTGDIGAIEDVLVSAVTDVIAHSLTIVVFLGMLFYLDSSLAMIALAVVPALAIASVAYARRTRSAQAAARTWASALLSAAQECLSAIALVKAFAREPFERERFARTTAGSLAARLRSIRLSAVFVPLGEVIATVGTVLVIWFGVREVTSGRLSLGGLVVFLGYLGSLYTPIQGLTRLAGTIQRALVGAERVAEVLVAEPAVHERHSERRLGAARGAVEFRDVTFGYDPTRPVLRGFSLTLRPGEMVALVGASGAGKTTVVSLLLAYYDPDAGAVTIDGADLRAVDPRSARHQIAAVLQEPMLFQASVRENLLYGRLDATDAEVETAARAAGADSFIRELPQGYETSCGPTGARLSGGQRQRLALARALLKDAPIVVLDEATSALDAVTEADVLRTLREKFRDRAILLVAHRFSTVRYADRIAVLADGRIVELGTHDELLARGGLYCQFYRRQMDPGGIPEGAIAGASLGTMP